MFTQMYGDGVWLGCSTDDDLWNWSRDIQVIGSRFDICARNGITFGAGVERCYIERNRFTSVFTTVIDAEPQEFLATVRHIRIRNNYIKGWFDPTVNSQLLISCVGSYTIGYSQASAARDWVIEANQIVDGGIHITAVVDVKVLHNRITIDKNNSASLAWSPIHVYNTGVDITVQGNYIYDNQTRSSGQTGHQGGIVVMFDATGNVNLQPSSVHVLDNFVHVRKSVDGIYVDAVGGFSIGDATAEVSPVTGTSTSVTRNTLTKTGAGWTVDRYKGWHVVIGGVIGLIESNTSDTLTLRTSTAVPVIDPNPSGWRTPLGGDTPIPASGNFVIQSVSGVVDVSGNQIDCGGDGGSAGGLGIYLFNDRAGARIRCANNKIKNATTWGIQINGAASKPIRSLELIDNKFWDDQSTVTSTACIRFVNAESVTAITNLKIRGNQMIGGVSALLSLGGGSTPWIVSIED